MNNQQLVKPIIAGSPLNQDYAFYKLEPYRKSKQGMSNLAATLGELAVSDPRKALVLRKYGLDYCFNGRKTLGEACAEKEVSTRNIEKELNATCQQSLVYTINYSSWELDYLADFIVTNHHAYTRKTLLCISHELEKLLKHQDNTFPKPLFKIIDQLQTDIQLVLQQEEQVLFPYIRFLVQVAKGKIVDTLPGGSISDHVKSIETEYQKIGEQMEFIRNFTGNYTQPRPGNSSYPLILLYLNEMDNDLHQHIHIESNILFPKAIQMEEEYLSYTRHSKTVSGKPVSSKYHHNDVF